MNLDQLGPVCIFDDIQTPNLVDASPPPPPAPQGTSGCWELRRNFQPAASCSAPGKPDAAPGRRDKAGAGPGLSRILYIFAPHGEKHLVLVKSPHSV